MPELPEVETTLRGIEPHVLNRTVVEMRVRQPRLRWPVPEEVQALRNVTVDSLARRGKYILMQTSAGTVLWHLGMSGSLRIVSADEPPEKHDHVDMVLDNGQCLRLRDPRRFGAVLWAGLDPYEHELLKTLGPEPLSDAFTADYLFERSRHRKQAIKTFIMDAHQVVGVGNIYANESLFRAGIHPKCAAGKVSRARYERLVSEIKLVLAEAIEQGGTTLRDFVSAEGKPGYFRLKLNVYGREGQPCTTCGAELKGIVLGQRATVYCGHCQT